MKKNSFIEGTIIATICIIIVKLLGMLYVIPFYAIVGSTGAALYAYAYNIYGLFLEIATAGIPNAVSKIINEYNTLDKQEAKIRTFKIGKRVLSFIAVAAFIILFVFAPQFGELIIGDLTGGNTIEDVTFVIRCVSFALLVLFNNFLIRFIKLNFSSTFVGILVCLFSINSPSIIVVAFLL